MNINEVAPVERENANFEIDLCVASYLSLVDAQSRWDIYLIENRLTKRFDYQTYKDLMNRVKEAIVRYPFALTEFDNLKSQLSLLKKSFKQKIRDEVSNVQGRPDSFRLEQAGDLGNLITNTLGIALQQNKTKYSNELFQQLDSLQTFIMSGARDLPQPVEIDSPRQPRTVAPQEIYQVMMQQVDNQGSLRVGDVSNFIDRGGKIILLNQQDKISIPKDKPVITGCTSGQNRSQVAYAVLTQAGYTVKTVLAGGDTAMNPDAYCHLNNSPWASEADKATFERTFGMERSNRLFTLHNGNHIFEPNALKAQFQDYFNRLEPTNFVAFSASGPSLVKRLLAREGSLEGFTIYYLPWSDEIAHTPNGIAPMSDEAYRSLADKLINTLSLEPAAQ